MPNTPKPSYDELGASHQKEDVHAALKHSSVGLFPEAFCKIIPDIAQNPHYCSLVHADGAGTKTTIAYMMFKESEKISYFHSLAQDSTVMNTDDVLCVGAHNHFMLSNTIGRNKKNIPGKIIGAVIEGYEQIIQKLQQYGMNITSCGGETADLGDIVRTIILDSTLMTRMKREDVITAKNIKNGDVIVGLSSFGQAVYEEEYNSGISSNGLTLARHGLLHHDYYEKYPECVAPELDTSLAFFGDHYLKDKLKGTTLTIGEALLSPTRTYAPILIPILKNNPQINAMFHNTGGGQSKCLKFGRGVHYIKNNFFPIPAIFNSIQKSSNVDWKEMFQVFNMGHRLEIICAEDYAKSVILPQAKKMEVDARIIGHVELRKNSKKNKLTIEHSKFDITLESK